MKTARCMTKNRNSHRKYTECFDEEARETRRESDYKDHYGSTMFWLHILPTDSSFTASCNENASLGSPEIRVKMKSSLKKKTSKNGRCCNQKLATGPINYCLIVNEIHMIFG